MRLLTGDECGLLKECMPEVARKHANAQKKEDAPVLPFGAMPFVTSHGVYRVNRGEPQTRTFGIVDMSFLANNLSDSTASSNRESAAFSVLKRNGSVEFWRSSSSSNCDDNYSNKPRAYKKLLESKNVFESFKQNNALTSQSSPIRPLGLGYFEKSNLVCAGDMYGNISLLQPSTTNAKIVHSFNAYSNKQKHRGSATISYTPGNVVNKQLATAMACDALHQRVAIGGRERETTLLDIETGQILFKAKNLPPDPQTLLQQPVWPTSILFLDNNNTTITDKTMAVGTAYKQVRFYDVRDHSTIKRPTATTPEGLLEYRITALCQTMPYELVVGDTAGTMYSLDVRTLGRRSKTSIKKHVLGRYAGGPAGSIRQMQKHPSLPRLATVGLDRMLRIHDTKTRNLLDCIYMKQRLNCVLFSNERENSQDDDVITSTRILETVGNESDLEQDVIGQEDMVQDYVDSSAEEDNRSDDTDDDDVGEDGDDDSQSSSNEEGNCKSDNVSSDSSTGDGDDQHENSDSGGDDDDSVSSSLPDVHDSKSGESDSDDSDSSEEEEEEEIVIQAPKKRRRHVR